MNTDDDHPAAAREHRRPVVAGLLAVPAGVAALVLCARVLLGAREAAVPDGHRLVLAGIVLAAALAGVGAVALGLAALFGRRGPTAAAAAAQATAAAVPVPSSAAPPPSHGPTAAAADGDGDGRPVSFLLQDEITERQAEGGAAPDAASSSSPSSSSAEPPPASPSREP